MKMNTIKSITCMLTVTLCCWVLKDTLFAGQPTEIEDIAAGHGPALGQTIGQALTNNPVEGLANQKNLEFLYQTRAGQLARPAIFNKVFSTAAGANYDREVGAERQIQSFLDANPSVLRHAAEFVNPHVTGVPEQDIKKYRTFNEFFYRKLSPLGQNLRPFDLNTNIVSSPADCHLFVIPKLGEKNKDEFFVKDCLFNLRTFLGDIEGATPAIKSQAKRLANTYRNGSLLLFRLAPNDYHRFHFPFDCTPSAPQRITGTFESVNPIAYTPTVQPLLVNERHLIKLHSEVFGDVLLVIVGAVGVGKINETYTPNRLYHKGDEIGYFSFGASSLVLIFPKNTINIEQRFITKSSSLLEWRDTLGKYTQGEIVDYPETAIRLGETLATKIGL